MKTGINFERCNVSSAEKHNTRDKDYIAAVNASPNKKYSLFLDRTPMNSSWVNPAYAGKTLPEILGSLKELYKEKVGQAPQEKDRVREITDKKTGMKKTVTNAGWSPIREGVCPCREDTTIDDFKEFFEWLKEKGLTVIRVDIHHDEGHNDEFTGERKYNHHAHIVVDWVDHGTGKTRKLNKTDASEMQTRLAASLGMERGESKTVTGADHLTPAAFREKKAAERASELQKREAFLVNEISRLKEELSGLERCNASAKRSLAAVGLKNRLVRAFADKDAIREVEEVEEMREKLAEAVSEKEKAVSDAERARDERDKAVRARRKAEKDLDGAEERGAQQWKKKYDDLNAALEQKVTEARKEGAHAQHLKWTEWKSKTFDPLKQAASDAQKKVSSLEEQLAAKSKEYSRLWEAYQSLDFKYKALKSKTAKKGQGL